MRNVLKRRETGFLQAWAAERPRKPLVVRGARQVGKSTLVREFARAARMPLLEVNFERNPELRDAFNVRDPAKILATLALLTGRKALAGRDLLFLDEIQAAPEALASLRYFYEEVPDLHVVAAGSLMEFALGDARFPMPVGRIEYLHLGPLVFDDFLEATGHPELAAHLRGFSYENLNDDSFPEAVHAKYLELLREYCVVGGLPEAVSAFARTDRGRPPGDFARVARVQQSVVATYRDDFDKYSHGSLKGRIQMVFDKLPGMVGRKFQYAQVSRDHRAGRIADALRHLCKARVAWKVHRTAANGLPLAAEANERYFKCLYVDVGLMCAALRLNVLDLRQADLTVDNAGAVDEQFIGQQLLQGGPSHESPSLHYWGRDAKSASAEVDYLTVHGQRIIPVEVKAGATGTLKSMHQFLAEKRCSLGLRFNADMPRLLRDSKGLPDRTRIDYDLLSLPLYMVGHAHRLLGGLR